MDCIISIMKDPSHSGAHSIEIMNRNLGSDTTATTPNRAPCPCSVTTNRAPCSVFMVTISAAAGSIGARRHPPRQLCHDDIGSCADHSQPISVRAWGHCRVGLNPVLRSSEQSLDASHLLRADPGMNSSLITTYHSAWPRTDHISLFLAAMTKPESSHRAGLGSTGSALADAYRVDSVA